MVWCNVLANGSASVYARVPKPAEGVSCGSAGGAVYAMMTPIEMDHLNPLPLEPMSMQTAVRNRDVLRMLL